MLQTTPTKDKASALYTHKANNNNMMMLESIQKLDETLNLADYTSRQVAIITIIFLGILLVGLHERGGIRWYSLIHAIVSGYLSLICVWTSYHHNSLSSSGLCDGPLTSFHRITPAVS